MTEEELKARAVELRSLLNSKKQVLEETRRAYETESASLRAELDDVLHRLGEHERRHRDAYLQAVPEDVRLKEAKQGAAARLLAADFKSAEEDAWRVRNELDRLKKKKADLLVIKPAEERLVAFEARCAEIRGKLAEAQKEHNETLEWINNLLALHAEPI